MALATLQKIPLQTEWALGAPECGGEGTVYELYAHTLQILSYSILRPSLLHMLTLTFQLRKWRC